MKGKGKESVLALYHIGRWGAEDGRVRKDQWRSGTIAFPRGSSMMGAMRWWK